MWWVLCQSQDLLPPSRRECLTCQRLAFRKALGSAQRQRRGRAGARGREPGARLWRRHLLTLQGVSVSDRQGMTGLLVAPWGAAGGGRSTGSSPGPVLLTLGSVPVSGHLTAFPRLFKMERGLCYFLPLSFHPELGT